VAQDGTKPTAAPQAPPPAPQAPVQPVPPPKVQASQKKESVPPVAKAASAPSSGKKDAKPLMLPSPRVREPEVPSYRVSVTMPGNRRFTGVVTRDKLFNDLVRLNAHNTRDVYRRTEAFTLRFVDGVDGDVTLRWNQTVKVDVRAILDAAGLHTIEENYHRLMILKKEQEEADRLRQEAEDAKAREEGGEKPVDGEKPDKKEKEELPALLAEFRADAGWSTKRKEEIEWRRTIVGTAPSAEEQRFLEVYPKWLEAFNAWQAAHPAKPEGEKDEPAKDDTKKEDAKKDDSSKDKPKSGDAKKDGDEKKDESKKDERKDDDSKRDGDKKDEDKDDDSKKDESPKDPAPAHDPKDDGGGSR
jgi:hypothetical protein